MKKISIDNIISVNGFFEDLKQVHTTKNYEVDTICNSAIDNFIEKIGIESLKDLLTIDEINFILSIFERSNVEELTFLNDDEFQKFLYMIDDNVSGFFDNIDDFIDQLHSNNF